MASKIDYSIIIVSYNTREILSKCLKYVLDAVRFAEKTGDLTAETLVVDNASTDGSVEMVKIRHKTVRLLVQKTNLGFAKANNIGMKESSGKYIFLVNSDAFVEGETLVELINYLKANPNVGIVGPKLINQDGSLQPSGGYLPTPQNVFFWLTGLDHLPLISRFLTPVHPTKSDFFAKVCKVGWLTGAFLALPREVFIESGGFDENFFMYTEEVEWQKRIADLGFDIVYNPKVVVTHLGGASDVNKKNALVREMLGVVYFTQKHYSKSLVFVRHSILMGSLLRFIIFSLLGKQDKAQAYREILTKII